MVKTVKRKFRVGQIVCTKDHGVKGKIAGWGTVTQGSKGKKSVVYRLKILSGSQQRVIVKHEVWLTKCPRKRRK